MVCRKGHAEGTHGKTWSWQDGSDLINTITGGDIEDRGGEAVWPPQQDQVVRGSAGDQQTYTEIRVQITDTSLCTQLYPQVAEPALHISHDEGIGQWRNPSRAPGWGGTFVEIRESDVVAAFTS